MELNPDISYSIVVPVYNGAQTIARLYTEIAKVFAELGDTFEVIFVEDCGKDNSWAVICELVEQYSATVIGIQLAKNFGQHNALMCGLHFTRGAFIITLDDDLQLPPDQIPLLIKQQALTNADLVYGVFEEKKHAFYRNLGSNFVQYVYKTLFNQGGKLTAFRLMRKSLVQNVIRYTGSFAFLDGFLAWNTDAISHVIVRHDARLIGQSNYTIKKLFKLAFRLFTNFSYYPLRLFTIFGIICAVGSFIIAIYYLFKYYVGGIKVAGYTSLIVAITFFSGIQLLFIGLIAEYIGKIFLGSNNKPQYSIRIIKRVSP